MSFLELRKAIGVLGILLPIILLLGNLSCLSTIGSMSACYYTCMGDVFVGSLYLIGGFFITDRGYDKWDTWANRLAGICALLVANFPCEQNNNDCHIRNLPELVWRADIHYASASILFTTLGLISLILFTKTSGVMTPMKIIRNRIYKTCGVIILSSVVSLAIITKFNLFTGCNPIFICETVCLFAFGFSWLVKGQSFFKDKESNINATQSLPDAYAGEMNFDRIKTYKKLAEDYHISDGAIRDIFCKGADWYKEWVKILYEKAK